MAFGGIDLLEKCHCEQQPYVAPSIRSPLHEKDNSFIIGRKLIKENGLSICVLFMSED